jgi:hypothetical protein
MSRRYAKYVLLLQLAVFGAYMACAFFDVHQNKHVGPSSANLLLIFYWIFQVVGCALLGFSAYRMKRSIFFYGVAPLFAPLAGPWMSYLMLDGKRERNLV